MCFAGHRMITDMSQETKLMESSAQNEAENLSEASEELLGEESGQISSFNSKSLYGRRLPDGKVQVAVSFRGTEPLTYAWYIYEAEDNGNPVEKIKYTENPLLEYELPDLQKEYEIKCFVRGAQSGEQQSAWVTNWSENENGLVLGEKVGDFERTCVDIKKELEENTFTMINNYIASGDMKVSWYVYLADNTDEPIEKTTYSYDMTYTYKLPDACERYAIKLFLKDMKSGEQKSQWVAYLPFEDEVSDEELIPEFTYESIQRKVLPEGYEFTNLYSEDGTESGFRIYERNGLDLVLWKTVEGNDLIFTDYDRDTNYVLKAYVKRADGTEKELDFYYLYAEEVGTYLAKGLRGVQASFEELKGGIYQGVDISIPVDWTLADVEDQGGVINHIQSFRVINQFLDEYIQTGNPEAAEWFLKYIEDWLDNNSEIPEDYDTGLWSDFYITGRVRTISAGRILLDHEINNELLRKMENHLQKCSKFLTQEVFYKKKHNHGMYQDLALLYYLNAFGYLDSRQYSDQELAVSRLLAYLDFAIAEDGVHKEHSPSYHSDIWENVNWIQEYFKIFDIPGAAELEVRNEEMREFFFDLIMPDFTWPPLGDSYNTILHPDCLKGDPYLEWLDAKGKSGIHPVKNMAVYPEGGYAIMRSSWEDSAEEGTYLLLTAATHSFAHKHQDDLNFILYHKGQLFTEAGKRNYNYDNPMTYYAYSSFGHNVLFVNKQGWLMSETNHPVLDDAAYETKLIDWGEEEGVMWATGKSVRWPTVTQERTIRYDHSANEAEIIDVLTATEKENIRLIYHIAEGVEIEPTETGWLLSRDGEAVAEVHVNATGEETLKTLQGEESDGDFKTWLFDTDNLDKPIYGSLLMVDMVCTQGENRVSLEISLK